MVLHTCNADGGNKLPPLAPVKYESPHFFKDFKILPQNTMLIKIPRHLPWYLKIVTQLGHNMNPES